jgi:hypothetical protein
MIRKVNDDTIPIPVLLNAKNQFRISDKNSTVFVDPSIEGL